jgi:hypothetical protein
MIVAGGDAASILQSIEYVFNFVAPFMQVHVLGLLEFAAACE